MRLVDPRFFVGTNTSEGRRVPSENVRALQPPDGNRAGDGWVEDLPAFVAVHSVQDGGGWAAPVLDALTQTWTSLHARMKDAT